MLLSNCVCQWRCLLSAQKFPLKFEDKTSIICVILSFLQNTSSANHLWLFSGNCTASSRWQKKKGKIGMGACGWPGSRSPEKSVLFQMAKCWGCTSGGVCVPCIYSHAPDESYRRRLQSLLSCLCDLFQALINSLGCWFCKMLRMHLWWSLCTVCLLNFMSQVRVHVGDSSLCCVCVTSFKR